MKSTSVYKQIRQSFFNHNYMKFLITILVLLLNSALLLGISVILQKALDIAVSGTRRELAKIACFCIGYITCIALVWLLERHIRNAFLEQAMRQYKECVFTRITQKNISSFQSESISSYISALTNDISSIENNYLGGTFNLIANTIFFVGAISTMFWYNWLLTVVALGLASTSLLVSISIGRKLTIAEYKVSEANRSFVGLIKDLLGGFPVIKSFQAEKEITSLFCTNNTGIERTKCLRRKTEALVNIVSMTMGLILQTGMIMVGVLFTLEGKITPGVLIAFMQLMNFLINPAQQIPTLLANRKAASSLIDKMEDALNKNVQWTGKRSISCISNAISLEHVTFGYDEKTPILKDINITFEAGKSYAIVGASGCGKSTLLSLLLGGLDGYEGHIWFDDVELHDITMDSLYDILSIIQQNVFVFDSTIENNITMFKEFPKNKIESAILRAGLHSLLEERCPEYECGENGKELSGGERQRISIARTLLKETPILLMDEATAALDLATAFLVEDAILSIEGITRVIVTHKLEENMLNRYDKIIVLVNGAIFETGTFQELISQQGYFYTLYNINHLE